MVENAWQPRELECKRDITEKISTRNGDNKENKKPQEDLRKLFEETPQWMS
jgi:hypothetical protein